MSRLPFSVLIGPCISTPQVNEIVEKAPLLPADIRWRFIGHLQSNKVSSGMQCHVTLCVLS